MTGLATNLIQAQKFSRAPSLLSLAHVQNVSALAQAPERSAEATRKTEQRCLSLFSPGSAGNEKPFVFEGGIAIIPVYGALLHRDSWCDDFATGYDYIASRLAAALNDDDVNGVLFDINSYGGQVAGNFELCDMIYAARARKPMAAMVDACALSGGYSILSAVGQAYATPSSEIGSIGVVMLHMSYEKMMENAGVTPTFIFAGSHKVDGNQYEGLSDEARKAFQVSVEKSYNRFVSLVARNRNLDEKLVRGTEAQIFDAKDASAIGLIDGIASPKDVLSMLSSGSNSTMLISEEAKKMSDDSQGAAKSLDDAKREGALAAQTRIASILSCAEANQREKLANHLAFNTDASVESAREILAAAEVATPAATGLLSAAMAGEENVTVGSGGGELIELSRTDRILAAYAKAAGVRRQ